MTMEIFVDALRRIHDRTKKRDSYGLRGFKRAHDNFELAKEGFLERTRAAGDEIYGKARKDLAAMGFG